MDVPTVTPDPPSFRWRALLALLRRLPQAGLSRSLGRLADIPLPEATRAPILGAFARAFGIDVDEAERPLEAYGSLNELFVRHLKPGARSWPDRPGLQSPVDGIVGQVGRIDHGQLIQAKGRDYAAADLLGDAREAARFEGGLFLTLYLSPRHYHRIHTPQPGAIPGARYVPGGLLPVNGPSVQHTEDLFARNERLLCYVEGDEGMVAVVAVGAYNVGRISAAFDPAWSGDDDRPWVTNRKELDDGGPAVERERRYAPAVSVARGEEIMAFHLGSTVILLTEPGRHTFAEAAVPGREVRVGELLATRDTAALPASGAPP